MIYNLSKDIDIKSFVLKTEHFIDKGFIVELKKKQKTRSVNQNAYLHVLFSKWGIEHGYNLEEAKTVIKRACPFGTYEKNNKRFLIKTSKLSTEGLTEFINWFRDYSALNGFYLLTSDEYKENKILIDEEIKRFKQYL